MFPREEQRKEEKKMKVIDSRKRPNMKQFAAIKVGECFIDDDGDIGIKVANYDTNETSAVCLKDGQQWFPLLTDVYEIITATLEIY